MVNPGRAVTDSTALDEDDDRHLWVNDPVHPANPAYEAIADMLIEQAGALKGGRNKRKGGDNMENQNKRHKASPNTDWRDIRGPSFIGGPSRGIGPYRGRRRGGRWGAGPRGRPGAPRWRRAAF